MQSVHTKSSRPLSSITKVFILLIPLLIIAAFVTFFTDIFVVLIICLLFALVLNPIVDFTQSFGIARSLSILIVYVIIAAVLYASVTMLAPSIIQQGSELQKSYKDIEVSEKLKTVEKWLEKNVPFMKKGDIMKELETTFKASFAKVEDLISGVLSTIIFIIIIPIITFFVLRDRQMIRKSFISLVPNRYFEMSINIVDKIERQLSSYVRGWLLDALFVGLLTFAGLNILGINNAFLIGSVAGLGHLIPYAGPIIGGVPALLISIIQFGDFSMVIPIVLMFTIIYVLDNSIAQPFIFSKSADMNPITIIALILIGNQILGAFGALIVIPIATVLKVSARETINGFRNYKLGYY